MQGRSRNSLVRNLAATAHDLRQRFAAELAAGSSTLLVARDSLAVALKREVSADEAADILAQAAACAAPLVAVASAPAWLLDQLSTWERFALIIASSSVFPTLSLSHSLTSPGHLYEPFLHHYAARDRKRRGVFFTPKPIADYIVTQIDQLLHDEFNLPDGLTTQSQIPNPKSQILLDPACGTGIFLLAAIDHVHRSLTGQWMQAGCDDAERHLRWNAFVPDLLSRLVGVEILPAAAFLTKLNLTLQLAQTGFDFQTPCTLNILTGDALCPNLQSKIQNLKSKIPIVLGNPPFSSLSTNTNPWIAQLVRGDDEVRGYVNANGQRLGERKTWLHDDYVKFIRLAQWHVEQAGCGIVGFVTSHGYLDNATFRLMRQELLRVFPRIQILDLHGSRKNHEVAPDRSRDENVFHLDQGLAIGLFCRPPSPGGRESFAGVTNHHEPVSTAIDSRPLSPVHPDGHRRIEHSDLWGSRAAKLSALADPSLALRACVLVPQSPHWRFTPSSTAPPHPEYAAAWSLADAMPVNTPAPVTARDHFVVAFTREELHERIAEFRDLSIPDDEIRRRYFTRTRSARYESGDTRGWKLTAARQTIAADADWQQRIIRCLYRPFDWRYVFWHPAMIDWPRTAVTRHLIENEESSRFKVQGSKLDTTTLNFELGTLNCCLIARRQQLPTQPCTFFWISDGLALDGVIRSDNRGSESLFPLYVSSSRFKVQSSKPAMPSTLNFEPGTLNSWHPNFAPAFLEQLQARIGRRPQPEETLAYIYALFHSPTYRERFADELRSDFPRVLLPHTPVLFDELSRLGQRCIGLHLQQNVEGEPEGAERHGGRSLQEIPQRAGEIESFRAGGYVALKKWLQPKHRQPADPEYARIVGAIGETIRLMRAIDEAIVRSGGWEVAFAQCGNTAAPPPLAGSPALRSSPLAAPHTTSAGRATGHRETPAR